MTLRKIVDIINNQLIITLPENFRGKKKVLVTVNDSISTNSEKLLFLKGAATDPLFLADMKEIATDFGSIDNETL